MAKPPLWIAAVLTLGWRLRTATALATATAPPPSAKTSSPPSAFALGPVRSRRLRRLLLLILWLRRCGRLLLRGTIGAAAAATTSPAATPLRTFLLRLIRLRPFLLLRSGLTVVRTRRPLQRRLRLRRAMVAILLRTVPLATLATFSLIGWRGPVRPALFAFRSATVLLLELLDLALHEAARLRVLPYAGLIVTAVGTALPAFRICLTAVRADDALRQRHSKSFSVYPERSEDRAGGAHCTLHRRGPRRGSQADVADAHRARRGEQSGGLLERSIRRGSPAFAVIGRGVERVGHERGDDCDGVSRRR